ncbi:hypothetical protein BDN70DRAFT_929457 [Pholiota conissans]|uniref:Uncharacterized protein n=1 Tax=Pholiota conissans TaxID=109636 RepID=A0A9P6CWN8_9AGAR|nr:hypothetical protein BDN70DRAFT_929457 [Pholiota conissans]
MSTPTKRRYIPKKLRHIPATHLNNEFPRIRVESTDSQPTQTIESAERAEPSTLPVTQAAQTDESVGVSAISPPPGGLLENRFSTEAPTESQVDAYTPAEYTYNPYVVPQTNFNNYVFPNAENCSLMVQSYPTTSYTNNSNAHGQERDVYWQDNGVTDHEFQDQIGDNFGNNSGDKNF